VSSRYADGARAAASIAPAVAAFGLSFGVLARAAGLGWAAPLVMSATTFAGSAQIATVSILGNGGAAAAIAAAVMLNARYVPIGISVAPWFEGSPAKRLLRAQLIVDESWAIALRRREGPNLRVLLGAGGLLWVCWNGGTALGVLLGNAIGDPSRLGLDAAFPALFLALLVGQVRDRFGVAAAVLGAAIAVLLVPFTPGGSADRRRRGRVPRRLGAEVSPIWFSVAVVGAATAPCKAAGPVLLGRRSLPSRLAAPVAYLAPAVLAALVVTQAVGGDRELVVDPRLAGLGAGAVAAAFRAPLLVVVVVAAATAALARLV
jgi:4-azaleucine resistance transporter AzlC